jgi:ParB-like chromosome segregation protein Spo0J
MKKHKYNIFPEAKAEDYARLIEDIRANGFDQKQPVTLYQGEVLDGWNRTKACADLGITPPTVTFTGTDADAIAFVMRTNKRRNLNSGQWACIAAEADDLLALIAQATEEERRKIQAASLKETNAQRAVSAAGVCNKELLQTPKRDPNEKATATKAAELFNTNRTYVNQAVKMKEKAPEVFEKVKAGKMTMQDANKAVRAIPTDPWLDDEKSRKEQVESGESVIANQQRDKNLIQWAERNGKAVRVDRGSLYGNPFVLGQDGDRDAVCDAYADHYLPHKPSIINALSSLKGKVLICHCYPLRCHAESLIK